MEVQDVIKRFGAVTALAGVSVQVRAGEILGLIGDNGAGKSSLVKIMTGFHRPDAGRILVEGHEVNLKSVAFARSLGIETVYQDLALIDHLSVYENVFLNRELVWPRPLALRKKREMRRLASEHLRSMRIDIPSVDATVGSLSGGQRQAIAVARAAYSTNVRILLLDEPLAAMGAKESRLVLDVVRHLRDQSVAIVVIAHNYAQMLQLCDRVNLLQHGRIVLDKEVAETNLEELTELVVGEYGAVLARREGEPHRGGEVAET